MRAAAAAALALVAAALGACANDTGVGGAVAPEQPGTAIAPGAQAEPLPSPGSGSRLVELEPGTYRTAVFRPSFRITVGEGWAVPYPEEETVVTLVRDGGVASLNVVNLTRATRAPGTGAVDPSTEAAFDEETNGVSPEDLVPLPADVAAWLAAHPRLEADPPEPVALGGIEGTAVETLVADGYPFGGCPPGTVCVPLLSLPPGAFSYLGGDEQRAIVLEVSGETLLVTIEVRVELFARYAPVAEQVLSTLVWEG